MARFIYDAFVSHLSTQMEHTTVFFPDYTQIGRQPLFVMELLTSSHSVVKFRSERIKYEILRTLSFEVIFYSYQTTKLIFSSDSYRLLIADNIHERQ